MPDVRRLAGPAFLAIGTLHFVKPRWFEAIMPDYLPAHRELVLASGLAEIAGGAALLAPSEGVRRKGALWLLATLAGVYPANIHMALHPERYPQIPRAALLARLPLQFVFAAWVLAAAKR